MNLPKWTKKNKGRWCSLKPQKVCGGLGISISKQYMRDMNRARQITWSECSCSCISTIAYPLCGCDFCWIEVMDASLRCFFHPASDDN